VRNWRDSPVIDLEAPPLWEEFGGLFSRKVNASSSVVPGMGEPWMTAALSCWKRLSCRGCAVVSIVAMLDNGTRSLPGPRT
jgi:hypothetical protein